jgi:hypothetical protein
MGCAVGNDPIFAVLFSLFTSDIFIITDSVGFFAPNSSRRDGKCVPVGVCLNPVWCF